MRNTFIQTLVELAKEDDRVFLITPDLGFSVLEEFEKSFPDRFLNVGIAEANAVGIAAGLALSGKIVYIYSIIPFVTMRPFEQIRVDVAYMNTNVRLIGVGAGITYGPAGATHHAIEDLAIMRALPNMSVVSPADPYEAMELAKQSLSHKGPIYFRLAKKGEPIISAKNSTITLGKFNPIQNDFKNNIAILFTGNASDIALEVSEEMKNIGSSCDLVSIHTLKPFDYVSLEQLLKEKDAIFTIEEHNVLGGLGSIVSEYIAESEHNPQFKRFGLPDTYSHYVGGQKFIREKLGLTSENIFKTIQSLLDIRNRGESSC